MPRQRAGFWSRRPLCFEGMDGKVRVLLAEATSGEPDFRSVLVVQDGMVYPGHVGWPRSFLRSGTLPQREERRLRFVVV